MSRPSLLFLAQTLPYPPDGGVKIRTYNILRLLSRRFDVDALCFYREAAHSSAHHVDESVEELQRFASVEAFPIPQEHSRTRLLWDHLRSVLVGRPYTYYTYQSRGFGTRLEALLREKDYDLVHVDSMDLSFYLSRLTNSHLVCGHHNVESELLRRRADSVDNAVKAGYLRRQARLLEEEEDLWCPRVDLNVTVSARDRETLRKRVPDADIDVVPNGVDVESYRPSDRETDGIVFVGGCTWFPNRDALDYFSEDILPLVRERQPEVSVRWVGRAVPEVRAVFEERHGLARVLGFDPGVAGEAAGGDEKAAVAGA